MRAEQSYTVKNIRIFTGPALRYSVDFKGVDLTGLLGGHKRQLAVWGTEVPQRGPGAEPW